MTIKNTLISKGFVIAGLMNASVLVFSKLFTSSSIPEFDASVMSNFGLLMIFIWGLAYISVAKNYHQVKWLVFVFTIEKLIYGCVWINWMFYNSVSDVYDKDILAGVFYSIYGVNDWLFFVFFLLVFVQILKTKSI